MNKSFSSLDSSMKEELHALKNEVTAAHRIADLATQASSGFSEFLFLNCFTIPSSLTCYSFRQ